MRTFILLAQKKKTNRKERISLHFYASGSTRERLTLYVALLLANQTQCFSNNGSSPDESIERLENVLLYELHERNIIANGAAFTFRRLIYSYIVGSNEACS